MIAWLDPQTRSVEVIPVSDGKTLFPSLIHLSPDGTIVAGEAAQPALTLHPDEVIFSVKRLIGISSTEFEQLRPHYAYLKNARFGVNGVEIPGPDGKWFSAIDLSAQILSSIVAEAAAIKNVSVARAVITVPAYFDESQRTSTKRAGELAGLEVLRIINEPTAACLAYGYGDSTNAARSVVVYDLGGGTFDVSIVRVESGVFEVLSTNGNTQLGGDDIDRSIVSYWRHQHSMLLPDDRDSLRTMAKMAKESLSENDQFSSVYKDITLHLTKQTLGELSAPWIDKTIQSCQFALNDAGMKISEVDDVILVGGSTRMPYIKARVADFFQKPVNDRINPDEVVAVGAAIQAAQLSGTEMGHLLLDVTPLSLGIETAGGLMDVLIPRNSKIPMGVSRQYTTQRDGQSSIRISIYQGERDLITYNRELASFQVTGIPAMPAGLPKLNVSFHIDADGLLRVTAQEMRSGVRHEVVVNPAANLTKDQIDQRLEEAFLHADEDKEARTRISLQEEAQSMITNLQKIIRTNQEWIDPSVSQDLINRCQQLEEASHKGTIAEIRSILEELEKVARPVAEEVMNKAVGNRLRDTSI